MHRYLRSTRDAGECRRIAVAPMTISQSNIVRLDFTIVASRPATPASV